jgi:hypothetical protein
MQFLEIKKRKRSQDKNKGEKHYKTFN